MGVGFSSGMSIFNFDTKGSLISGVALKKSLHNLIKFSAVFYYIVKN